MPSTVTSALAAHLAGETTNLCTLWDIVRKDGTTHYFTDHDDEIVFDGKTYTCGLGYNRSALEDKFDLSVDNMDVKGVLDTSNISREDIRGGRYDGATITITVVNWANLSHGGIVKRKGWFGTVKQNNRGEFDTELRGLSEALQQQFTATYTPGCSVNLGSTKCGIPLETDPPDWVDETLYPTGTFITVYPSDLIFQCTTRGITNALSDFDEALYIAAIEGDTIVDGTAVFTARLPFAHTFTVVSVTDRRTFEVSVNATRLGDDPTFFDGGLVNFTTGDNISVAREVGEFTPNSADDGSVSLFLRMPFEIQVGDTGTLYPGCTKAVDVCKARYTNVVNFQGFPHVPGDRYLKDYPDAK